MLVAKMCKKFISLGWLRWKLGQLTPVLAGMCLLQMPVLAQPAGSVASTWKFDPLTSQFEISVQQGTPLNYYTLNQPARVVLEVGNTILGGNPIRQSYSTGRVRGIQVSQIQGGKIRIILELTDAVLNPNEVTIQQEPALVTGGGFLDRWVVRGLSPQVVEEPATGATTPVATTPMTTSASAMTTMPLAQNTIPSVASLPVRPMVGIGVPMPEVFTPPAPSTPSVVQMSPPMMSLPPIMELPKENWTPPQSPIVAVPPPVEMVGFEPVLPPPSLPSLPMNPPQSRELVVREGTELRLRYTGNRYVNLEKDFERQEVLVLDEALRDEAGNVVVFEGTPVIGRFETNNRGSKFVAQAITLGGRNVRLEAASGRLQELFRLEPGLVVTVRLNEDLR
ncbi:MAG TPA: AMIN domain-containing protein [Halomicronema sp.]